MPRFALRVVDVVFTGLLASLSILAFIDGEGAQGVVWLLLAAVPHHLVEYTLFQEWRASIK